MDEATNLRVSDDKTVLTFDYAGRSLTINYDGAAKYHATASTPKIARLAACVPSDVQTVFDVGANCGLFAAFAAARCPAAHVHAFEPSADVFPLIAVNAPTAHAHPLAVGAEEGTAVFYVNRFSQQTNSVVRTAVAPFAKDGQIETRHVRQTTIDAFCAKRPIGAVEVLKIDVQGAEGPVLRGAKNQLRGTRVLLIESSWLELDSVSSVVPFARHYGFRWLGVVNPVHLGADLILAREEEDLPGDLPARFDLAEPIRAWF